MIREKVFGLIIVFSSIILNCDADAISDIFNFFQDSSPPSNDSDTYLTPLRIIRKYGYPAEGHIVESQGYFLELHRIPHGKSGHGHKKRIPIYLHHGLLSSSMTWILHGPGKSLAYKLADEGFDVWMDNARGNTFSRSHVKYRTDEKEFWDFSFHEMGVYDLPAAIDHILKINGNEQLVHIGYSLGATIFYIMASLLPEYNKKVKFQISLSPAAAIPHASSAIRSWGEYAEMINMNKPDSYRKGVFLEDSLETQIFTKLACIDPDTCKDHIMYSIFGKDTEQLNTSLIPLIKNNFPAGTSIKNLIHSTQLTRNRTFHQYDYGMEGNIEHYGRDFPPAYDLSRISVPIRIYYGESDIFSPPIDIANLYENFTKPLGLVRVNFDKFNHMDFIWAKDIDKLLYNDVIEFVKNSTNHYDGLNSIRGTARCAANEGSFGLEPYLNHLQFFSLALIYLYMNKLII